MQVTNRRLKQEKHSHFKVWLVLFWIELYFYFIPYIIRKMWLRSSIVKVKYMSEWGKIQKKGKFFLSQPDMPFLHPFSFFYHPLYPFSLFLTFLMFRFLTFFQTQRQWGTYSYFFKIKIQSKYVPYQQEIAFHKVSQFSMENSRFCRGELLSFFGYELWLIYQIKWMFLTKT